MSKNNWDPNLSPEQNYILKQEGTEAPGSSALNNEKREGSYHCVGCDTKLFDSKTKFESGSGWPSFFESLPDVFDEKTDMHAPRNFKTKLLPFVYPPHTHRTATRSKRYARAT